MHGPFEDFTAEERLEYPEAFAISPSKAMVALHAAIDAEPEALGFVLPRGVLQHECRSCGGGSQPSMAASSWCRFPIESFEKATYPCALVIATNGRPVENAGKPMRLIAKTVADNARAQFLADGLVSSVREAVRPALEGDLWVSELEALWSYLQDAPRLGDHAEIFAASSGVLSGRACSTKLARCASAKSTSLEIALPRSI